MSHDNEYYDNMITMLELVWGEGYMAPGGAGNVRRMLSDIDARDARILDFGCGIGGPAFEMARSFGAHVTGIDLEAPLIERARIRARELGIEAQTRFEVVDAGPLMFDDESFDVVVTAGALTQTEDKASVIRDCLRILAPGGYLSCYDWTRTGQDYSDDMHYWFKMEGLTYALETLDNYGRLLTDCGFVDVNVEDASEWYRDRVGQEYEQIKDELFPQMVNLIGQKDAEHFVENWRAMMVVCDSGEMRQGYCRGRKLS